MKMNTRHERWREVALFAFFFLVALYLMAPVLPHWRTQMYGGVGDSTIYAYMAGWMLHAVQNGQSPFFDPQLNFPDGLMLTGTDIPYLHLLAALPITERFGPVATLNSIILLCHFLSGYLPYLWIRALTQNRAAALVAGLAFVLTPYRIVHSVHINLVATHVLVLFFWALDNALASTCNRENSQASRRKLFWLAGATFYAGGTSQYYLAICLVCGALYLALMNWRAWSRILPVWLLGALVSALPYLALVGGGTFQSSHILASRDYSASPLDFLIPSTLHPLWGRFVSNTLGVANSERTIYIGVAALFLAFIALRHKATDDALQRGRRRAWIGVIALAALFALGTDLHLLHGPLSSQHPLWLPSFYLGQLPFAGIMRVWARFGIVSILFVALLAGFGMARGMEKFPESPQKRGVVALLGTMLVLLDLGTVLSTPQSLALRPIDRWLIRQPGDFVVASLPVSSEVAPLFQSAYASLWHRHRLPMTVHPKHQPPAFRRFYALAAKFPNQKSISGLQTMGFRYLLLDSAQFDGVATAHWSSVESALKRWPGLRFVDRVGSIVIVQLPDLPVK